MQDEGVHVCAQFSHQKRDPMRHKAGDEVNVAAQPIELGDRDWAFPTACFFKGGGQFQL